MRKFSLFILLATSAVPAIAAPGDGHRGSRNGGSEQSDNQAQRAERQQARQQRQADRQQSGQSDNSAAVAALRQRYQQQAQQQQAQQQQAQQQQAQQQQAQQQQRFRQQPLQRQQGGSALVSRYRQLQEQQAQGQFRDGAAQEQYRQRRLEAQQGGTYVPRQGRYRTIPQTRPQYGVSGPVRSDVRSSQRYDRNDRNRWTSQWRNDNRYDWRRYRDRNRTVFQIGFYSDPFGYDYRRFSIGSFLYPNYYQSNYWISDPWQYRLPPAYGPYRWVRYHNDAVLIDTYTGEVEDVIYGFFW